MKRFYHRYGACWMAKYCNLASYRAFTRYLKVIMIVGLPLFFMPLHAQGESSRIVLVTGFEAFGGDATNGSWEAVRPLNDKRYRKVKVVVAQLPVVWGEANKKLQALIKTYNPVMVISFGQAGEEPVRLETTAHNLREKIPDNKGKTPPELQVYPQAPASLATALPVPEIEAQLRAAGIPVSVSNDAGTYLCNDIFYTLMYDPGNTSAKKIPRGFVHVPPLNATVKKKDGSVVLFNTALLQKTAEVIVQTSVGILQ